jgi:hypothetical protein
LAEKDHDSKENQRIPFYVRKQENLTLEKGENNSEHNRNSPKFHQNNNSRENQRKQTDVNESEYFLNKIKEKLEINKNEDILRSIDELVDKKNYDKLKENVSL